MSICSHVIGNQFFYNSRSKVKVADIYFDMVGKDIVYELKLRLRFLLSGSRSFGCKR